LFGLTNAEGNHGEDVKEYYFYLDNTPTHSYIKMLYKHPQTAYPYDRLVQENARRNKQQPEYELLDTGVFDANRYFDVFVEYAKAGAEDILIRISASNRGREKAPLHVLPTLWYRNTWSWVIDGSRPVLREDTEAQPQLPAVLVEHPLLGSYCLCCEGSPELLFTENDTNCQRLFGVPNLAAFVKDAFHACLIQNNGAAVNPQKRGTKAAAHYTFSVEGGSTVTLRLRLTRSTDGNVPDPFATFDATLEKRQQEADEFYAAFQPPSLSEDERRLQRQAYAGLLWSKQFYHYDVDRWLLGDPSQPPPPPQRRHGRNHDWDYFNTEDIVSVPDKWEFPWFAAWDQGFHCVALARIDPDYAKSQLILLWRITAWGVSARSLTATRPSPRAAASPMPGAWPKCCARGR
jgi:hypothetical protein